MERKENELTLTAIVLGVILSVVFGAANAYLGLRVGLTVSASIPAAVISMGVLRVLLRRDSIRENNMVQTIGSAGESLAAGAIFTLPALYLWAQEGLCPPPGMLPLTLIALSGGLLGVLLMVPLRRPLVVDEDKTLVFPEGRACVEVLKAGEKGARQARTVFGGLLFSAVVKIVIDVLHWLPPSLFHAFRSFRGALGLELSPALVGVGYIVGPQVAGLLFAGSFFGWMVLIPVLCVVHPELATLWGQEGARAVWSEAVRYVGAGAIATGGFLSLAKSMPLFVRTFCALKGATASAAETERDLPLGRVLVGVGCIVVFLWAVPAVPVGFLGALLIAVFGFFFAAVSARMCGLVGSSNNPISGMTIATLVVASLALKATGTAGAAGMVAAIAIGSVVCIVAAIAGDTAQDLKTGHLLGVTPWKQQVGELIGVVASAIAIGGVLLLLHRAWGFGSDQIAAPQAMLMKVIVEGIMGGNLPWAFLAIGAGLAVVLALLRIPVMPFAIGLYLPIGLNAAILVGGLVRFVQDRFSKPVEPGTLFSAGLIAGEGLCGILLALWAVLF